MEEKKGHVIYLGCSGFPYGLAEVERQKLISKSLVGVNTRVLIINRKGSHRSSARDIKAQGQFEGIDYIYSSGDPYRPQGFIRRNWLKIVGHINEFRIIYKENKKLKINAGIVSTMSFQLVVYYFLLSKLFRFKLVLNYVEFRSKIKLRLILRPNNYLFDKYTVHLSDIILPISNFLVDYTIKKAPGKPYLKIPSICDFEKFNVPRNDSPEKYFLFCGSGIYYEVIEFTINAFNQIANGEYRLKLIINGESWQKDMVKAKINDSPKKDLIDFTSDLTYSKLVEYYINASALLIPLRATLQDIARFPHKISEYTASKNPIITTNVGEIPLYFKNEHNALIAEHFDYKEFATKMEYVIQNPDKSIQIGLNGYDTGLQYFNYKSYGIPLRQLLVESK